MECGLERQFPLPSTEETLAYYEGHYRHGRLRPMVEEVDMTRIRSERRFREIQKDLSPGRLLDVGCSTGAFVKIALDHGIDCDDIELASAAVVTAQSEDLPVSRSRIEDHKPDYLYDAVTAFDVLEHVPYAEGFLDNVNRLLRPGKFLALSVPNLGSISRRLMGQHWYFYIPDGHLYYCGRRSLTQTLERHGFSIVSMNTTAKPVTVAYSITQIEVLSPKGGRLVRAAASVLPARANSMSIPLYLGELLCIARRIGN